MNITRSVAVAVSLLPRLHLVALWESVSPAELDAKSATGERVLTRKAYGLFATFVVIVVTFFVLRAA